MLNLQLDTDARTKNWRKNPKPRVPSFCVSDKLSHLKNIAKYIITAFKHISSMLTNVNV